MTNTNDQHEKKVGLYFGTFNPIHMGHLVIANHMATYTDLDEVWLVVTPLNPHKSINEMMNQEHRLQMVHLAVSENELLKGCDVEFEMPQPNYYGCNDEVHAIAASGSRIQYHYWRR
jgi:nicotinate-nucleotide adenylyltransferase